MLPNLIRAFGHPPDRLIIDETGSNMGTHLRAWCEYAKVEYDTMKLFPYLDNIQDSVINHLKALDKAHGVIMFQKEDNILSKVVVDSCRRKFLPLITYHIR